MMHSVLAIDVQQHCGEIHRVRSVQTLCCSCASSALYKHCRIFCSRPVSHSTLRDDTVQSIPYLLRCLQLLQMERGDCQTWYAEGSCSCACSCRCCRR
jgi:hypothetical protein